MDLFKRIQQFPVYSWSRHPKEVTITMTVPVSCLYEVLSLLREKAVAFRQLADRDYKDAGIDHRGDPHKYREKYSFRHWIEQSVPLTIFIDRLECAVAKVLK